MTEVNTYSKQYKYSKQQQYKYTFDRLNEVGKDSGIYMIKCMDSGKFYVGSTVGFRDRWSKHRLELRKNIHHNKYLQRAYNKYGKDSFVFMVWEFVDKEELIPREQQYLDMYYDEQDRCYNIEPIAGRPRPNNKIKIKMYNPITLELIDIFETASVLAKELNIAHGSLRNCLTGQRVHCKGYIFLRDYEKYDILLERQQKYLERYPPILMYNKNGLIGKFALRKEILDKYKILSNPGISKCLRNNSFTTKGYTFSYNQLTNEELKTRFYIPSVLAKKINQLTLDEEYIKTFDSIEQAIKEIGVTSIREALSGRCKTAGGYKWKYI